MGATACMIKVPAAVHCGAADNRETRCEDIPTEGEAQCSYTTANNLACAALEQWKAANPWWNTVQMHVAPPCLALPVKHVRSPECPTDGGDGLRTMPTLSVMQVKNKHLPQEFWDLRRRARNSKRSLQQHAKKTERQQATKR
jgi:hypothetical protein